MRVKNVFMQAGIKLDTALVSIGWVCFFAGALMPDPVVKATLMAMARVLPKALYA
jgi:hypothetical protein